MIVLLAVIAISFRDGEYGLPAVIGAAIAIALGPAIYGWRVKWAVNS